MFFVSNWYVRQILKAHSQKSDLFTRLEKSVIRLVILFKNGKSFKFSPTHVNLLGCVEKIFLLHQKDCLFLFMNTNVKEMKILTKYCGRR
jgi:hypothetical protein